MTLLSTYSCIAQGLAGTRVVLMKNKVGFFLPVPVETAFDVVAEELVGGKEKWLVITAAIIALLEKSPAERGEMVKRVRMEAGKDGNFPRLVADATAKGLGVAGEPPNPPPGHTIALPPPPAATPRPRRRRDGKGKGQARAR